MKYSTVLFGVLATASLVSAAAYPAPKSSVATPDDDCDGYPMSEPAKVTPKPSSSKKVAAAPSSTPYHDDDCPEEYMTKPASSKKAVAPVYKPSSSYKKVFPYPVETTTTIIVVPTFTVECHGPTTIIEETETIIITVLEEVIVTFSKGPYTRTKTHLECGTTTTDYFKEVPCPTGWPYETGYDYVPIPCSYVPVYYATPVAYVTPVVYATPSATPYVAAVAAPAPAPYVAPAYVAPAPAYPVNSTTTYKSPVAVYLSGASRTQAGVVALIAGAVAAVMVL